MSLEWNFYKLEDLINLRTGKLDSNAEESNGNYPFFTCAPDPLRINSFSFNQKAILLAGNNANGNFHINYYEGKFDAYQRTYVIDVLDEEKIDLKFLYYALKICLNDFKRMSQGTSTRFLTKKILDNFEVQVPQMETQLKIVEILDSISNKIKNNQEININLTRVSSNIFTNLIEKNNEFMELQECCKFIKGKKPKEISDYPQSNFLDYLTIDVLSNQSQMYASDEKGVLANEYDILMVMDGASSGKLFYGKSGLVGSTLAKLDVDDKYLEIVYQFLKHSEKFISDNTTGSAIPHTDKGLVLNLKCPISEELLNYSDTFKSIRSSIITNNNEILKLQKLRDTLLPKLMSGEIDVSQINCDMLPTSRKNWDNEFTSAIQNNLIEVIS